MDDSQDFPEESMRHIEALLSRHPPQVIQRMFQQMIESRRNSTASSFTSSSFASSNSSLRSRLSITSSFSISSSDFAPSIASSASSRSRSRRQEPRSYPSGLDPTRPVPSVHTPVSDISSPRDPTLETSVTPTDEDLNSIASPLEFPNERNQVSSGDSYWFCTSCAELKALKTFRAKSDWKKHEMRMHQTGEDWPCPAPGCTRIYDRQKDFTKHYQRHHPGRPLLSPTDIRIQLLPRRVYGCGFDDCKEVSIGWDERCDHVAKHMKNGLTFSDWKYSNVIRNLIRQKATHDTWKELFSSLDERLRASRSQISWCPDNTRTLKQKLECCDLRPSREEVLTTALVLRSDIPVEPLELPPGFVTPSKDSVPENFDRLSREQRMHILNGDSTISLSPTRMETITAALLTASSSIPGPSPLPTASFIESSNPPNNEPQPVVDSTGRRISYMDLDPAEFLDLTQPDVPQMPPDLDSQMASDHEHLENSGFIDPGRPSNPLGWCYPNYFDAAPTFEESQYYNRPSLGQSLLRRVRSGLGSRRQHHGSTPSPMHEPGATADATVPHVLPGHTMRPQYRHPDGVAEQLRLFTSQS